MSENEAGGGEEGELGMSFLYLLLRHVQTAHSDADVLPPTEGRLWASPRWWQKRSNLSSNSRPEAEQ